MSKNSASAIGIIGGADGPTSVFIAGKVNGRKLPFFKRMKQKWNLYHYKKRRAKVEKSIEANPHTLDEVMEYICDRYGATEIPTDSKKYIHQKKHMRESLILQHHPALLGDLQKMDFPEDANEKEIQEFLEKVKERTEMAGQIPDELFPMDYHVFEIEFEGIGNIHFEIEKKYEILSGSYSGKKKGIKKLAKINRDIYQYYGVTKKDIEEKSKRYSALVTTLSLKS